ncbi:lytic murein transglycosylase [Acinetobacter baumannii]|uniref:lytic murein transglycosylase n=1 Tax=Acinetobacter baumannii TaxID=470 RepID=UPI00028C3BE4|nr:lytic murein transglycosylase [Acinetobacter baumannii]EHU1442802.1 lytic murein transglycosylase [Acinetobacter baumannii]EHU1810616.1 lytic murein transglycosylase [Acinetobacter baumannii]EHU2700346.1 lytic murein transglycosylase [Acinetobacter baumannii]EKL60678.1 lytic murein transglycosylase [Acinetobacter baumannii OIFC110]TPT81288.1 lytic murein transglycosylase [Acinetobacter baumannii]
MRRFSCIVGSVFLAMTQAQAELVINGSTISSNATVPVTNSDTYTPNNNFQSCLANLRSQAIAAGVSGSTYDRYTQNLTPDYSVIDKLNYQPEFSTPIWDYLSGLVDEERVALGKQKLAQHRDVLNRASQVYGVPAETIVAVWGVESNFGDISGKYPLLQALGTLSCEGRRQSYFRTEFFATMRILQRGDLTEDQLKGSWAGAFGHTQFMPSTYERLAVDFDGDGRRDLVSSTADALASTANFLNKAGWQTGMPWGFEVQIPAGMSIDGEGRRSKKPLSSWSARGVTRIDGSPLIQGPLSGSTPAGLMAPAGPSGPVFLVFKNFDAIYSYNAAESYGLAIAHLSDRLRGASPFVSSWPTDDPGTSRAERREIQQFLINRGYDIGAVDGLIGDKTRVAIRQEQTRLGLNPTGRAGQQILRAFRQEQARKMMQ